MDRPVPSPAKTGTSETSRLEAFSDGVIAIIITIMVLEMRAPHQPSLAALLHLWPVLMAYALSFVQVAIYWVNHHELLDRAEKSTNGLRWANMLWLFCLSLIPFGTAWFGDFPADNIPTATYLATLLLPALAYAWLEKEAMCGVRPADRDRRAHVIQRRKSFASLSFYAAGIALAFVTTTASIACVAVVALIWILPGSRIDVCFGGGRARS
jgi:uncharacterized membrane protein